MTTPAMAASCWNCGQPVQASATSCLWCGVAQQRAAQFVLAPGGGTGADGVTLSPVPSAAQPTPSVGFAGAAPSPRAVAMPGAMPIRTVIPLSKAFGGSASSVGAQLAAFTIDALLVAVTVGVVHALAGEPVLTFIALIEALVFMLVLEARTGATPGNLVVRLRTSRADAPYSPGVGRVFVRHVITGAAFAVVAVGAWAVVASGAIDSSGRRRSLAARASGTQSVTVPRRAASTGVPAAVALASVSMPAVRQPSVVSPSRGGDAHPAVTLADGTSPIAPPHVMTALEPGASANEDSVSMSMTGTHAGGTAPVDHAPAPAPAAPIAPAPGVPASRVNLSEVDFGGAGAADNDAAGSDSPTTLLLVFDTGQRETMPIPTAVNLGRKPTATEPGDHLVSVKDAEGTVSKTHARLEHSRHRTWVTDQGSTNGTEVLEDDGEVTRLQPHVRTEVPDGARVRLGNRTFTLSTLLTTQGTPS